MANHEVNVYGNERGSHHLNGLALHLVRYGLRKLCQRLLKSSGVNFAFHKPRIGTHLTPFLIDGRNSELRCPFTPSITVHVPVLAMYQSRPQTFISSTEQ